MAPPLRALVADDEPPARRLLAELLSGFSEVLVAGEAVDGDDVVRQVLDSAAAGAPFDVVFLDVRMPGMDGFEALGALAEAGHALPHVVFTTAHDAHAVRAFEAGAVDYLLKPLALSRVRTAVERVLARERPLAATDLGAVAAAVRRPDRLLVRAGSRLVALGPEDVVWAEAAGNYARLHTAAGPATPGPTYLAGVGLGEVEQRLPAGQFVRVHRSSLVAVVALRQLESDGSGGYVALLDGGHEVRVSRTYADDLRRLVL